VPRDVYIRESAFYVGTCVKAWTVPSRYGPLLWGVAHWSQLPCYRNSGHKVKIQLAVAACENRVAARKKKSGYSSSLSLSDLLLVSSMRHPANLLACKDTSCNMSRRWLAKTDQSLYRITHITDWSSVRNEWVIKYTVFLPIYRFFDIMHEKNLGLARRLSSMPFKLLSF